MSKVCLQHVPVLSIPDRDEARLVGHELPDLLADRRRIKFVVIHQTLDFHFGPRMELPIVIVDGCTDVVPKLLRETPPCHTNSKRWEYRGPPRPQFQ